MTLGDVVIQNLGDESIHTKEEIISAMKQNSRLLRVHGLGNLIVGYHMLRGLELKDQAEHTASTDSLCYQRVLELVRFDRQSDGYYMVHKSQFNVFEF